RKTQKKNYITKNANSVQKTHLGFFIGSLYVRVFYGFAYVCFMRSIRFGMGAFYALLCFSFLFFSFFYAFAYVWVRFMRCFAFLFFSFLFFMRVLCGFYAAFYVCVLFVRFMYVL